MDHTPKDIALTTLARLRRSHLALIAPLDHKPVAHYRRPHRKKVS